MSFVSKILARAGELARASVALPARAVLTVTALLALSACGQRGALYLPTEPAAAQRATLLQTLRFGQPAPAPAAPAPAAAASAPTGTP